MIAIPRMRPRTWFVIVGISGLLAGIAWPPPPIPKGTQQADAWSLPGEEVMTRFSADDFQAATRNLRWNPTGSGTGSEASKSWRLAGFLNEPATAALIEVEGAARRVTHVKPGDSLPDGSRLVRIDEGAIITELDGCTRTQQLYRSKPTSATGSCEAAAAAPETRKAP